MKQIKYTEIDKSKQLVVFVLGLIILAAILGVAWLVLAFLESHGLSWVFWLGAGSWFIWHMWRDAGELSK